jgi:ATP-dependent Lon protease
MANFEDIESMPADFTGRVRLFPLPNLVLFPHVMQPLHIFEPRYRAMLEDALEHDRLIAMATLCPGWENQYEGRPAVYPVACLGRIATHHCLDDGTYNVLLFGLRRVKLLRELEPQQLFRLADVEVCEDCCLPQEAAVRAELQRRLRQAFLRIIPVLPEAQEQLEHLLGSDVSLGVLTDVIGYVLDIPVAEKQNLLAEVNAHRRAELLLTHLTAAAEEHSLGPSGTSGFPPTFSPN